MVIIIKRLYFNFLGTTMAFLRMIKGSPYINDHPEKCGRICERLFEYSKNVDCLSVLE